MDLHNKPSMGLTRRRLSRLLPVAFLFLVFFILLRRFSSPALEIEAPQAAASRRPVQFKPSSVDWSDAKLFFPSKSTIVSLPRGKPKKLPRVQSTSISNRLTKETQERRTAVKDVFLRSWNAYKQQAWTWDELRPVSGGGKNAFGGWAASLVDGLDTLWMMGYVYWAHTSRALADSRSPHSLYDDFYEAAQVAAQLDWANTTETSANLFETTIRHLGGLLSAYDLSGERALLDKAKELGDMLYMAFDTPNRLPGR